MIKFLPYISCLVLLFIVLIQNRSCKPIPPTEKIDTVIVYKHIVDTIPGKPVYLKGKTVRDTIWMVSTENKPDTTYQGLLKQYTLLGNNHFEKRTFKTDFPIADYGTISVYDTVKANKLIGSSIITNLKIPITTITVEKTVPPKMQLFVGTSFTGNQFSPINGVYGDLILKTKKDRLYGVSIGYTGEINYKVGLHWPLKSK